MYSQLEPTKPPTKVNVMIVDRTKASVSWKPIPCPHQNGIIRFYLVRYVHSLFSGQVLEGNLTTELNFPAAELRDLRPNTNYVVMVAGWNRAGLGPYSSPVTFVTPGGKKKTMHERIRLRRVYRPLQTR